MNFLYMFKQIFTKFTLEKQITMKGMFTPKQLALLAIIFWKEDEALMPIYEQVAINVRKFIELGDPWTDESLLVFIQKSMEGDLDGKLKEIAVLKYYLSKIAIL